MLDAKTDTLVKRFSETRRRHPFSSESHTLTEAIDHERHLLADVRDLGFVFDTSDLPAAARLLLHHYEHAYVAPGERFPRRADTTDPFDRDVRDSPHPAVAGSDFTVNGWRRWPKVRGGDQRRRARGSRLRVSPCAGTRSCPSPAPRK